MSSALKASSIACLTGEGVGEEEVDVVVWAGLEVEGEVAARGGHREDVPCAREGRGVRGRPVIEPD